MESRKIIELMIKEIKYNSFINISEFFQNNNLKNIKIKDLVKEIEEKYSNQLIVDSKNTEVYSYDLIYNFFKLKLFKYLETGDDMDLSSDDFKPFKSDNLIKIFSVIDSEFFTYLLENI
ncbi:MAG: hypothetical protein ACFFDK_07635 [Promethearchaeota archaeon]